MKESKKNRSKLMLKSTLGLAVTIILLSVSLITAITKFAMDIVTEFYETKTVELSKSFARLIDGDRIARYPQTLEKDDYYNQTMELLRALQQDNNVRYLYVQQINPEEQTVTYIMDTDTEEPYELGQKVPFSDVNQGKELSDVLLVPFTSTDIYGWMCSTLAPVYNSAGEIAAAVGVDISMEYIRGQMRRVLFSIILIACLIAAIVLLAANIAISRMLVQPITKLSEAASCYDTKLILDNVYTELSRLQNNTGDEIEELTHSVQKMESDIKHYVRDLTAATAANEHVSAELSIAAGIQAAMLPDVFPAFPERQDFDLYAMMHPAKEVGGDFYDFFLLDYNHLAVIAADVSGKGVPAALFMVIAKTLIRNQALYGLPPEKIFSKVNMQLCENNKRKMFVTAWMGVLELSTGRVTFANAGHTRPIIARRDGTCEYLRSKANFVLAGMPMMQYTQGELQLNSGDTLFLYTDGVTEATSAQEELFGEARLLETIQKDSSASPADMIASVKASIDGFVLDAPQFDDITMLAVRYRGEESDVYTETKTFLAVKSELDSVLEWMESLLEKYDCPMKIQIQLNIAIEEIFINISNYAYPQGTSTCDITCHFSGDPVRLEIIFADKGVPYDPLKKKDPNTKLGADERKPGGLGIFMVKQSMDDVRYRYENGRNILTIVKMLG